MTALVARSRPIERYPLHPDEPCYALAELYLQTPGYHAEHRYQLVQVIREDRKQWIRIDMGDANGEPFRIVADGDGDTVASVQAQAERIRDDMYWAKFLAEEHAASTLIPDLINWHEEKRKRRHRSSTFGPNFTKERN